MDVAFQLLSGKCIDWDSAKTSFIEGLVSGLLPGGAVTDFLVGMAVDIGMRGETPANAFGNQMLGLGLDKFSRGFGKGARGADNAPRNGLRRSPTEAVERAGKNPKPSANNATVGGGGNNTGRLEEPRFSNDGKEFHGIYGDAPGDSGYKLKRALTPDEMMALTREFNDIEFGLGREVLPDGSGGDYWLFSGDNRSVLIPNSHNNRYMRAIAHTHPSGTQIPSKADIRGLVDNYEHIIPTTQGHIRLQDVSHIIVSEQGGGARAIPYYPYTSAGDYMPNGKYSQYYHLGGVDYTRR